MSGGGPGGEAGRRPAGRTVALVAAAVLLVAAALLAKHVLLDRARVPERARFEIDIERVRAVAGERAGDLPTRVNALVVASAQVPRGAVVAGGGLEPHELVRTAFQVLYPDGGFVVVDTALDRELHESLASDGLFHAADYRTLQAALARARGILVTHEHPDPLGGLARSPHAVAPGIVLVPAPGHTPGTQLVYVRLADGAEYLFVGDIAWHMDNLRLGVGRPLLVSRFLLGEDPGAVLDQLGALRELAAREPALRLVVSHDGDQLADRIGRGWIGPDFELPADASARPGGFR